MEALRRKFTVFSQILLIFVTFIHSNASEVVEDDAQTQTFKIEGKVIFPSTEKEINWATTTRILVDGGDYIGFLRNDGSFVVNNVPSGSYQIEFTHPSYLFESARVDITTKGKIRARRVNVIQPSEVKVLPYPLKIKPKSKDPIQYFHQREQWRITDFLFNPMVLMMVLPLLLIMVLPKLVNTNDPETQKEMQQQMNLLKPNQQMPEISEMFTSLFGGGGTAKKPAAKRAVKRR